MSRGTPAEYPAAGVSVSPLVVWVAECSSFNSCRGYCFLRPRQLKNMKQPWKDSQNLKLSFLWGRKINKGFGGRQT